MLVYSVDPLLCDGWVKLTGAVFIYSAAVTPRLFQVIQAVSLSNVQPGLPLYTALLRHYYCSMKFAYRHNDCLFDCCLACYQCKIGKSTYSTSICLSICKLFALANTGIGSLNLQFSIRSVNKHNLLTESSGWIVHCTSHGNRRYREAI